MHNVSSGKCQLRHSCFPEAEESSRIATKPRLGFGFVLFWGFLGGGLGFVTYFSFEGVKETFLQHSLFLQHITLRAKLTREASYKEHLALLLSREQGRRTQPEGHTTPFPLGAKKETFPTPPRAFIQSFNKGDSQVTSGSLRRFF